MNRNKNISIISIFPTPIKKQNLIIFENTTDENVKYNEVVILIKQYNDECTQEYNAIKDGYDFRLTNDIKLLVDTINNIYRYITIKYNTVFMLYD